MSRWEWSLSFLLAVAVIFLTVLYFQQFRPYQLGLNFLKEKDYSSARKEFLYILEQKPFLFPVRLNLALTESLQKNIPSAVGEYQVVAEDSSNEEERFYAQFNTAILKFLSGDISSSLEHYQQALKENPESMEVKVNIEWMMLVQDQQKKQQQQEQKEQGQENKQNEDFQDASEQKIQEMKEEKKDAEKMNEKMNEDQIQFIFKELEERERKLRSRLQDQKGKRRKGKSW